jgi:hypothetical protein
MEGRGMDATGLVKRHVAGCCKQGDETSDSKKVGEFIRWPRNHFASEKDSASSSLVSWSVGLLLCR